MNKQIDFLHKHCEFHSPYDCYVLMGLSRKKDSVNLTNGTEIVFSEILRCSEDIDNKFNKLKSSCENFIGNDGNKYPFYIYVTLNARDSKKAMKMLMEKLNQCIYEESNGREHGGIFKKIDREFLSKLLKPLSKSNNTNYFMIDVDTKDKKLLKHFEESQIGSFGIKVVKKIKTPNGYHYKTKPFNRKLIEGNYSEKFYSVEPDRLLFVEYIKNGVKK